MFYFVLFQLLGCQSPINTRHMLEVAQRESFKTNEELLLYGAEFDADDELAL